MTRSDLRNTLNALFMLIALIGVILYFSFPEQHIIGLAVIGVAMIVKIVEFFLRFLF
ncbi:MAG: hypothetical protein J5486_10240 [Bacteroidaceae bacterium]|nr:hypothetical protein [Bacteroidaceae bacterium]